MNRNRRAQNGSVRAIAMSLLGLAAAAASSCGEPPAAAPRPAPSVIVATPVRRNITVFSEYTGTTRATESVEVRARVTGELQEMNFRPSRRVEEGDVLFVIEPAPYEAARDEAQAAVQSAQADLARSVSDLTRAKQAAETNAIASTDLDLAQAKHDMAEASVLSSQARLQQAEIEYSYTQVEAPITGQVGRNRVDVGNVVGGVNPSLLTTINKLQPLFVYFDAPEEEVLKALKRLSQARDAGTPLTEEEREAEIRQQRVLVATLADEGYPYEGPVDFVSNTVDPGTGTIEVRAVLENAELTLFPGLFVRIRMPQAELENSILVDERAIGADLGGKYVYVVGEGNVVEQRPVKLGPLQEDKLVPVLEGLDGTETYIVEGLLRARPGLPVTPKRAEDAGDGGR